MNIFTMFAGLNYYQVKRLNTSVAYNLKTKLATRPKELSEERFKDNLNEMQLKYY